MENRMIYAHCVREGAGQSYRIEAEGEIPSDCIWLDVLEPSQAEEKLAEEWLQFELPTRDEMREIEPSSRLYEEGGAQYMTLTIVTSADSKQPRSSPATFVLSNKALVTIRYAESSAFRTFSHSIQRQTGLLATPADAMTALLDAIVDRLADILEKVQSDLDKVSHDVFSENTNIASPDFGHLISLIGQNGDLVSKLRESLVSAGRVDSYARQIEIIRNRKSAAARLKGLGDDIRSLTDHATFLNDKIDFLLNATLGRINIQQNATIKIFSVVAVVFLPPTLIASIYGMNFNVMPELQWEIGYPAALAAMIVAAVLPYLLFRRLGWL
jgi:magnesium transporter